MNKDKKIVIALLSCIAISEAVTAVEVIKAVREGMQIELTVEDAEVLSNEVKAAQAAFAADSLKVMQEEGL